KKVLKKEKWKKLPGHMTLVKLGYADLATAIQKNGGYFTIREKLGQTDRQRKRGAWKNETYVIQELERNMNEHKIDVLPSYLMLQEWGYSSLAAAINMHHGGIRNLRKKRGEKKIIHAAREWENFSYAKEQAEKVMRKHRLKNLPDILNLTKMGYGPLAKGIVRYHGGMRSFRDKLGQEQIATAAGTWSIEYTTQKAREAMKKLKVESLPCSEILKERGYTALASAIEKNYGFRKFRGLLGEEQKKTETINLKSFDYVRERTLAVMQEHEWQTMPSNETLRSIGESGLVAAIYKYHGGIVAFRKKMGQEQIRKPLNYWKDFKNVKDEAIKILEKFEVNMLPASRFLNEHGYASFVVAVQSYHGGFTIFREKLREYMGTPNESSQLENFLEKYIGGKHE
ncbi:MAG: hypothetical protein AABX16_01835, partial [Nanoarchaeota archaeon]